MHPEEPARFAKRRLLLAAFGYLLWAAAASAHAGQEPTPSLSFEVSSIRRNTSGAAAAPSVRVGEAGRFTATNLPLRQLIRYAYELQDSELIGGSAEQLAERFDVTAAPPRASSVREVRIMVQRLLTTRFNLKLRSDTRELPVYYLEMARADQRPQLRPSTAKCDVAAAGDFGAANADSSRSCGYLGPAPGASLASGRSMMALRGVTMDGFARLLEGPARRRIVNRTALVGVFDGEFDFSAELGPPPPLPGSPDPLDRQALPSLFTVLPEQLGLKLQAATAPVPVLVVEHVEAPTPN